MEYLEVKDSIVQEMLNYKSVKICEDFLEEMEIANIDSLYEPQINDLKDIEREYKIFFTRLLIIKQLIDYYCVLIRNLTLQISNIITKNKTRKIVVGEIIKNLVLFL